MMESLPIDTSHPAVRDYLALIRLQVLTPLSLLINIATVIVCSVVLHPGLSQISELYPSSIAPDPSLIAIYITAIYIGQIGYCVLLVFARKQETKVRTTLALSQSFIVGGPAIRHDCCWNGSRTGPKRLLRFADDAHALS
ncbi:hypothetical protein AcW1_002845 [Taiwanofungus camphoratus]|nr:hypothetical protein AcW1_002845 [Antrodia cinnamomea]